MGQTKINPDAKLKESKKDPLGTKYKCCKCGNLYDSQRNFYTSKSHIFEGNNGYFPVCKTCVKNYFDYLVDYFSGNEEKALDRMCSIMDIYYCDDAAVASKSVATSSSRIASYISRTQMQQNAKLGTTYLDTIKDRSTSSIDTIEDLEEINETGEKSISARLVKQWGFGYEPEEYSMLSEHYKILTAQFSNADAVQDTLIKDLCTIKVLQNRAMKAGSPDNFDKFTKLYHSTLKTGGLKTRSETDNTDDESVCWGNFIKNVEQYNPAEIYKDKALFNDVDEVESYFKRFILRPIKNFFTGTRIQDEEFNILVGDEDVKQNN